MDDQAETRWLAALTGHPIDLERWERELTHPHDPVCEPHLRADGPILCLHSRTFEGFLTAEEVLPEAERVVGLLNGAIRSVHTGDPIVVWAIGRVDVEGQLSLTQFAHVQETMRAHETLAVFLNGTAEQGDAEGGESLIDPPESDPQRWVRAAITDTRVAKLLSLGGKADSWIDIYKAYEAAGDLAGNEKKLLALMPGEASSVKLMRRTANTYRHAEAPTVEDPMSFNEARALLSRILVAAMKNAGF